VEQAQADLRVIFGSITVVGKEREIRFEAELRELRLTLLRGIGGTANNVVAGACFFYSLPGIGSLWHGSLG
jgi:hypothetical protein